jgi:poly(3-hydroxybutyrate) depolymerase
MKKIYLIFLSFIFATNIKAINISVTITSGGVTRNFLIHAPGTSVATNLPVMYVLHGDGGTATGIKSYSGFDSVADLQNFIAVYPNAHQAGGLWNKYVDFAAGDGGTGNASAVDDVQFFSDLTDYLCTTYAINTTKVFATGHSGGAYMCYHLALQLQNKIAGIAPVAGSCWGDNANLNTIFASASYVKMPIYHIHGDADATVAYPDPNHIPNAWTEWPFSFFGNYGCGNNTYTSTTNVPGTTTLGAVKKLEFCTGPSAGNKEILLIRIVGGGHGWPNVSGYKPAESIWNFCNQYALPLPISCAPPPPPPPVNGNVVGGITGPNIASQIHVSGKYILGPMGDTIVLRGVNYAPYNWGYDITELRIGQIALSNANAVRLVWYYNGGGAPVYPNWVAIDSAISKCVQAGMIAIPELHDQTCTQDSVALTNLIAWWTNPNMLTILNKYYGHVIVNFANEALGQGNWGWLGGSPASFKNIYGNIITQLRNQSGFVYPIMIDAPECGGNENGFLNNGVANYLTNIDPLQNIIYSVHAYWPTPTNTASVLQTRLTAMHNSTYPFILGEVAATVDCSDVVLLDSLLRYAKQKDMGWLAWSWDRDNCAARQMTTNGLFSSLTTVGTKLINNSQFGLASTAVKMLAPVNTPLQIHQLHLIGTQLNNQNKLQWQIAFAYKNAIIWSSENGNDFMKLKELEQGNQSFNVGKINKKMFYQLQVTDLKNEIHKSNIVALNGNKNEIKILQNANEIEIVGIQDNSEIKIFNLNGTEIYNNPKMDANTKISISSFASGLYFLQIKNNRELNVVKFLKN